jgi:hypothetical protein
MEHLFLVSSGATKKQSVLSIDWPYNVLPQTNIQRFAIHIYSICFQMFDIWLFIPILITCFIQNILKYENSNIYLKYIM